LIDSKSKDKEPHLASGGFDLKEAVKNNLPIIRFIAITVVSLITFFVLLSTKWVEAHFSTPYTNFVAASSRIFLRLFGIDTAGNGSLISSPQFTVNLLNVCNGIEATAIFFATILGFPATWKNKLIGLALGYPVIFLVNLLRIAALFIIGFKIPGIFDSVHYYYAQAVVILVTIGVWLFWVSRYSIYGSKSGTETSG